VAWRVGIDMSILVSLLAVILYYGVWGVPRKRGFFCNDPDLAHPFRNSSVSSALLFTTACLFPLALVTITEFLRSRRFVPSAFSFCREHARPFSPLALRPHGL
jgi:phosphatidate phosphatase